MKRAFHRAMLGANAELLLGMVQVELRSHRAVATRIVVVAANFVVLAAPRMQSLGTLAHGFVGLSLRVAIVGSPVHVTEPGSSSRVLHVSLHCSGWSEFSLLRFALAILGLVLALHIISFLCAHILVQLLN